MTISRRIFDGITGAVGVPNKRGKLFFMVGLPRSGKTVIADEWVRSWKHGENPRVIIGGDDYRTAIHGEIYRKEAEGTVFAMMDVSVRAQLDRGHDVLIDETCTTEATLLRYLRLDIDATPIFVDTCMEVCIDRAEDKPYLVKPIQRMAAQKGQLMAKWDETVARLRKYLVSRMSQDVPA